jgi:hypothetical protein
MRWMLKTVAKFVIALVVMTILCTFVWQRFIYGTLYYCSDPVWDFLSPGSWVHVVNGQPVQVVSHVVISSSWSVPDSIKDGWSETRLWHLWFLFVALSLVVSIAVSLLRWPPKSTPPNTSLEPTRLAAADSRQAADGLTSSFPRGSVLGR